MNRIEGLHVIAVNTIPMPLSSKKEVTKFVHRKLLFRFRRLVVFFIVIVSVVVYEVSHNYIAAYLAVGGLAIGLIIGLVVGKRMHTISWNAETNKAVTRMDRLGTIILVAYLIFAVGRKWIFSHWLSGYALSAFSMSVGAGGMFGRLYALRQRLRQVLKEEGILRRKKIVDE